MLLDLYSMRGRKCLSSAAIRYVDTLAPGEESTEFRALSILTILNMGFR